MCYEIRQLQSVGILAMLVPVVRRHCLKSVERLENARERKKLEVYEHKGE